MESIDTTIRRLKDHIRIHAQKEPHAYFTNRALELALNALKQQNTPPCLNCNDDGNFWKNQLSGEIPPDCYKYCHYCGRKLEVLNDRV